MIEIKSLPQKMAASRVQLKQKPERPGAIDIEETRYNVDDGTPFVVTTTITIAELENRLQEVREEATALEAMLDIVKGTSQGKGQ